MRYRHVTVEESSLGVPDCPGFDLLEGALQSNRAAFEVVAMERKDLSEC